MSERGSGPGHLKIEGAGRENCDCKQGRLLSVIGQPNFVIFRRICGKWCPRTLPAMYGT